MKTPCIYRGIEIVANVDGVNVRRCALFAHCVEGGEQRGIANCQNCGNYVPEKKQLKNSKQPLDL